MCQSINTKPFSTLLLLSKIGSYNKSHFSILGKIILLLLAVSIFIGAAVVLYITYLIRNLRFSGNRRSSRSTNQYSRGYASLLSWFCGPSRNMGGYENSQSVYSWFGKGIHTMMGNMFDPRKTVEIWNEEKLVVGREAVLKLQVCCFLMTFGAKKGLMNWIFIIKRKLDSSVYQHVI